MGFLGVCVGVSVWLCEPYIITNLMQVCGNSFRDTNYKQINYTARDYFKLCD